MRLLLKFLSLDIVTLMVVAFQGDFMGNGRVLLSGGIAPSKEFGVILWAGRSPFFLLLLSFSFLTSGVPPNEVFQSRALGRATGQSEIWLKIGA